MKFYCFGEEAKPVILLLALSACAHPFDAAYDKAGAKYTMHIETGMCHCYPMLTFFPKGKEPMRRSLRF